MSNLSNTQINVIPHSHVVSDITDLNLADKQDKLIAWTNIQIAWDGKTISATDTTYSAATTSTLWLMKLWDATVQSVAKNAASAVDNRTYPVQVDTGWQAVVNIPWTDTTPWSASASTAGTIKLWSDTPQSIAANAVSSTSNRTYAVQVNSSWQAVVNVPWTDNNTQYSTATSSTAGIVKLGSDTKQTTAANAVSSTASRTYAVQLNNSDQMVVNVPWEDTHVTVTDNLTSSSTSAALSANQGRVLKWYIDDLNAKAHFLSLWNCTTWQPISFPLTTPYTYTTGDYFLVETVPSSWSKYMPNGVSYTWSASTTVDSTNDVQKWDFYIYDGTTWLYASNHGKEVTFSNIAWQPTDNTNLAAALWDKQDTPAHWKFVIWMDTNTYEWLSTEEKNDWTLRIITDSPELEIWAPTVYCTWDEYKDLPDSKNTDWKNYIIYE